MKKTKSCRFIASIVLLVALITSIPPVLADNSSVSIMYRGEGGHYIGDTIIIDGTNTAGNVTVLKLTGPGLPAGGVPVYDLNGKEGTGNPVGVQDGGIWHFVWYTSSIKGIDKMQTARYHVTAVDLNDPTKTASTSFMMKKPDFYVVATPDTLETGDYLQLVGTAEQGISDIRIQVSDLGGNVLHSYDTYATSSGYFTYNFHVDMQPGVYYITVSSPFERNTFRTTITVTPPETPASAASPSSPENNASGADPQVTTQPGVTNPQPASPAKNPLSLPLSPLAALTGVLFAGILFIVLPRGWKKD